MIIWLNERTDERTYERTEGKREEIDTWNTSERIDWIYIYLLSVFHMATEAILIVNNTVSIASGVGTNSIGGHPASFHRNLGDQFVRAFFLLLLLGEKLVGL